MFTKVGETDRIATPDEREAMEDVLDAAVEWEAGRLPFDDAIRIGTLPNARGNPSPEWSRALAFRMVAGSDPRKASLYRLSENGSRMRGKVLTAFGIFDRYELQRSDDQIRFMKNRGDL